MIKDNDGMELVDANINLQQSFPADLQIQKSKTFPLPMKRIPSFRLVCKRFYDPNAPPCKAVLCDNY